MNNYHSLVLDQKESTKHGEHSFPVQKYITTLSSDCPVVTTHWHEEAELAMLMEGDCTYQIDLKEYHIQAGDLVFIPPLILHSIYNKLNNEILSETFVFHLNFLGANTTDICSTQYLTPIMNLELSIPFIISPEHKAYCSLKDIYYQISYLYAEKSYGYELAIKGLLLQAIFLLLQTREKTNFPNVSNKSDNLRSVLDYIELNYAKNLTISELADVCNFSDYHFMRFFKKHMNMTCIEYINNLRLEKSVELFKQGNTSIVDVSLSVGFNNLSYFYRAFKEKYHMTPLSYIKLTPS